MTNGEMIQKMFPQIEVLSINEDSIYIDIKGWNDFNDVVSFNADWWNAEYKEPTTKNDLGVEDCVSRQAIIDEMEKRHAKGDYITKGFVKNLPSVTPQEPKIGHWIANAPQYDMLNPQYICSECGNAHTRTTPYCEMCGAKMVESQESEDKE